MRQVPGSADGEWAARLREQARRDADELFAEPPFEVFGLAEPRPAPAALAETHRSNGEWESITLAYGDWAQPSGPYATVTTTLAGREPLQRSAAIELANAITGERNRVAEHAGVDEEEPPGRPDYQEENLRLGQALVSALVCRHGGVWAARAQAGPVSVSVVGRGIVLGSVRLVPVTDLEPYWRARGEMIARIAGLHRRRPPPELAPAEGVGAFRALADTVLASHTRLLEQLRTRCTPRHQANEGAVYHALWRRAVTEYARIWGTGRSRADQVVTMVINHLTHLQEQAPWFTAAPRLREAAIDETLRHAVLGHSVPSLPAQRAWAYHWAQRGPLPGHQPGETATYSAAGRPLTATWLQAWSDWTRQS